MIRQLESHLSQAQIDIVVDIIINQYSNYRRLIDSQSFQSIFLEEYAPHNRQFGVSWAISSAFPSGSSIGNDFAISRYKYSKNFTRPLLSNDSIKIMILNKTTHFNADYLTDFYNLNVNRYQGDQLFCFFKFSVDNRRLTKISLCLPDQNGKIIAEEVILNKNQIEIRVVA